MKQTEKMKKAGREFAPDELSPRQQVAVLMISAATTPPRS